MLQKHAGNISIVLEIPKRTCAPNHRRHHDDLIHNFTNILYRVQSHYAVKTVKDRIHDQIKELLTQNVHITRILFADRRAHAGGPRGAHKSSSDRPVGHRPPQCVSLCGAPPNHIPGIKCFLGLIFIIVIKLKNLDYVMICFKQFFN